MTRPAIMVPRESLWDQSGQRKSARIACKYRRFGRFPVAEKQVLQYNDNPITEPLDVCLAEGLFLA